MSIYEVTQSRFVPLQTTVFATHGLSEPGDLQRLLRDQVEIIAPNVLVISEEFCDWEDSTRRIDLLGIDREANLVVIELKQTDDRGHMDLQAIRYAAMVSRMTFEKVVEVFQRHLADQRRDESARETLLDFLGRDGPEEAKFGQDVRIVLASAEFSRELTTAVLWLNERGLDIRCVRLRPHTDGDRVLSMCNRSSPSQKQATTLSASGRSEKKNANRADANSSGAACGS
jgi:hypothetical protein